MLQVVVFEKGGYNTEIYMGAAVMKARGLLNHVGLRNIWSTGEYERGF